MAVIFKIKQQETTAIKSLPMNYDLEVLEEEITTAELIRRSVQEHLRRPESKSSAQSSCCSMTSGSKIK